MYSSVQRVRRNLVAGFKKCGIYPLNVSIVLNHFPDADKNIENIKTNAVVNVLKRLRRVDGKEKKKPKRKKKLLLTLEKVFL